MLGLNSPFRGTFHLRNIPLFCWVLLMVWMYTLNSVHCLRLFHVVVSSPRLASCQAMRWLSLPPCLLMLLKAAACLTGNPWSCFPLFSLHWPVQRRVSLMGKVTPLSSFSPACPPFLWNQLLKDFCCFR